MTRAMLTVGALTGALLGAPGAYAQNALGGGDALDANLNPYSGGYNAPTRQLDFRARNLLITGDAIDGRSFQDIVGYSATDDFRGDLPVELQLLGLDAGGGTSDALYTFRRDAASADPTLFRLGSRYDRVRYGYNANEITYRRESTVATSRHISEGGRGDVSPGQYESRRIVFDQQTLAQSLRAEADRAAEPQLVGRTFGAGDQPMVVSASPLLGLTQDPAEATGFSDLTRLSTFDLARLREDLEAGAPLERPGEEFRASFGNVLDDARMGGEATDSRVDLAVGEDYKDILAEIAARYAARENVDLEIQPGLTDELDDTMEQLRQGLQQGPKKPAAPEQGTADPEAEKERTPMGRERPGVEREGDEEREPGRVRVPDGIGIMLRHGQEIDTLSTEDENRVNELITAAEQRLRDGEYFWAERRFDRALRFVPGHPLATAGLGHAQIGAGLYLRAGLTLRSLLQRQPEMIDASYGEGLLPSRAALLSAVDEIRGRLTDGTSGGDKLSYGFLLAYLGHQLDDRGLIEEGLAICEQAAPEDPLTALLRQVWIDGEVPQK